MTIRIDGLAVARGGKLVLPGISLDIRGDRVTGLLGPSGSGKSTLTRSIVGVQIVASGRVDVLGLPAGDPALRPRVGYVTQAPSVYTNLTVRENLEYFCAVLGAPRARVDEALGSVYLGEHEGRIVRTLSGGEPSRVSLASALLGHPEALVLDEPTVGLDPVLRRDLWATFHKLAAAGATLLVSSHVMDEAERCDDLVLCGRDRSSRLRRRTSCASAPARRISRRRSSSWRRRREPPDHACDRGTGPPPAPARPAHACARPRRPAGASDADALRLRWPAGDVRPGRAAARRGPSRSPASRARSCSWSPWR